MLCPKCGSGSTWVVSSKIHKLHNYKWRRRECQVCGHRFTTYEVENTKELWDAVRKLDKIQEIVNE